MSNLGYIKKNRSDKAKLLKRNHTSAFLVLDTVAENAKRKLGEGHPLLEIGEAIITAEECGVTKNQFPRALIYLESMGMVQVVHRGRKDKNSKLSFDSRIKAESHATKSSIKSRINGTVVKLIDSECYDINLDEEKNQKQNQSRITCNEKQNKEELKKEELKEEQPKEKSKKEKSPAKGAALPEKIAYREFVTLTLDEHTKLMALHGPDKLGRMLDILNSYVGRSGKKYISDYHAMSTGSWVLKEAEKESQSNQSSPKASSESNMQFAKKVSQEYKSSYSTIEAGNDALWFYPIGGVGGGFCIPYRENGFKDQVMSTLEKRQFRKADLTK